LPLSNCHILLIPENLKIGIDATFITHDKKSFVKMLVPTLFSAEIRSCLPHVGRGVLKIYDVKS